MDKEKVIRRSGIFLLILGTLVLFAVRDVANVTRSVPLKQNRGTLLVTLATSLKKMSKEFV